MAVKSSTASRGEWLTDLPAIQSLAAKQGVPAAAIAALGTTGYRLERARLCLLKKQIFLHLVYSKRRLTKYSVYLRPRGRPIAVRRLYPSGLRRHRKSGVLSNRSPDGRVCRGAIQRGCSGHRSRRRKRTLNRALVSAGVGRRPGSHLPAVGPSDFAGMREVRSIARAPPEHSNGVADFHLMSRLHPCRISILGGKPSNFQCVDVAESSFTSI